MYKYRINNNREEYHVERGSGNGAQGPFTGKCIHLRKEETAYRCPNDGVNETLIHKYKSTITPHIHICNLDEFINMLCDIRNDIMEE